MSLTTLIVVTGGRNCSGSDCVGYLGLQGVHHIVVMATINHYNSHQMLEHSAYDLCYETAKNMMTYVSIQSAYNMAYCMHSERRHMLELVL